MFERDKKESNNLISPCCGLLRHVVEKVSYLRINVPHNDSEISSLAPCCGRGLGRGGENNLILSECEESHKIGKSYEILRSFTLPQYDDITNSEKDNKNVKNLFPYSLNALVPKKKAAFTLAEILITLGIIGIVAAMTIPTLITRYQKREVATKLKATYSTIANALKLAEEENGDLDFTGNTALENFDKYLLPYLKVTSKQLNGGKISFLYPDGKRKEQLLSVIASGGYSYTLLSGVQIFVPKDTSFKNRMGMLIDLNGYNSPPNKMGRDAFYLMVVPELGVHFNQYNDDEYNSDIFTKKSREQLKNGPAQYNYQCNKQGNGMWCGALIQRDGWTIQDDYPW